MNKSNFDSLSNIGVQTLNQPISRSKGEGYQLDVHVCNVRHSGLYTYSQGKALYQLCFEDHSDLLGSFDAIFQTVWDRYSEEKAPTRCFEDGYEIHVSVLDADDCEPSQSDFRSSQQFTVNLNEDSSLVEDVDRLFASL